MQMSRMGCLHRFLPVLGMHAKQYCTAFADIAVSGQRVEDCISCHV